jgi:hypothetical protein
MKNANLDFGLCVIRKLILNDFDSYSHVCLSCIAPCHLAKGSLTNQLFHNISAWQTQITISILLLYNCPLPHHVPAQKAIIDSSDPPEEWENTAWSVVNRQKQLGKVCIQQTQQMVNGVLITETCILQFSKNF